MAVTHIDEIERRPNGWIPVRDHFGVRAFGVNAWTQRESDGALIAAHAEAGVGHEELYFVHRGHATFTIEDEEVDAPEGTFVFVQDPSVTRAAVPKTADTVILTIGGKPGEAFRVSDWELAWRHNQRAFPLYREGKYAEAANALRGALDEFPDNASVHYNLACYESLAGEKERALEHLRRAFELSRSFFAFAETDSDLDPIRSEAGYPA